MIFCDYWLWLLPWWTIYCCHRIERTDIPSWVDRNAMIVWRIPRGCCWTPYKQHCATYNPSFLILNVPLLLGETYLFVVQLYRFYQTTRVLHLKSAPPSIFKLVHTHPSKCKLSVNTFTDTSTINRRNNVFKDLISHQYSYFLPSCQWTGLSYGQPLVVHIFCVFRW